MTPDDQLDTVLRHLDKVESDFLMAPHIKEKTLTDISNKDFDLLLDKLVIDGHILQHNLLDKGLDKLLPPAAYRITFQGRQFLNHSFIYKNRPYKAKATLAKINKVWTIIKTTVIIINAVIILSIAAIGVWVSYDSKQKDLKIEGQKLKLDKQATTIDSLQHLRTTTKTDTTK